MPVSSDTNAFFTAWRAINENYQTAGIVCIVLSVALFTLIALFSLSRSTSGRAVWLRYVLFGLFCSIILVQIVIFGFVYTRVGIVLVAGEFVVALGATLYRRGARETPTTASKLSTSAVLGLLVLVLALAQVFSPSTGLLYPSTACPDAPVLGSALLVRTNEAGANSHNGPGTTYPQGRHYDSSCIVGVDGFCVGEGITDPTVGVADLRWFRVHLTNEYISASPLFLLGADSAVEDSGTANCPGAVTLSLDKKFDAQLSSPKSVTVRATAHTSAGAPAAVGVAILSKPSGNLHYAQLQDVVKPHARLSDNPLTRENESKEDVSSGDWAGTVSTSRPLFVVAAACLAANVPLRTSAEVKRWDSMSATFRKVSIDTLKASGFDPQRVLATACRSAPVGAVPTS